MVACDSKDVSFLYFFNQVMFLDSYSHRISLNVIETADKAIDYKMYQVLAVMNIMFQCPFEWFHYHCVGIKEPPKGKWFCPHCTEAKLRKNIPVV